MGVLFLLLFILSCKGLNAEHKPFQIIKPNASHDRLEVVETGLQELSRVNESISLVTAVGPYHSGKSFLLNIIRGESSGFKVGPSTDPETMGVWLLMTEQRASDGSRVVLVDTEGFYGFEASEAYDAKIFAVVTLISSHLVFNSVKIITQDQVDYLELLARRAQLFSLTSYISTQLSPSTVPPSSAAAAAAASTEAGERETSSARTKEEGLGDQDQINSLGANMEAGSGGSDAVDSVEMLWTEQQAVIPPLTWVVQDFFQDVDSPQQWLQRYIQGQHQDSSISPEERGLDKIFTNGIHCMTLFLPAVHRNQLRDLSAVEKEKLTPEFRADVQALRHHILQQTKAKETLTTRTSQTHATFDAYENRARNVKHTGKERSSASAAESTSTPGSNDDEQAGHDAASVESKTGEENEIENSGGDERANDGDQKAMASKSMTGQSLTTLVRFLVHMTEKEKFPRLPSLWSSWLQNSGQEAIAAAHSFYCSRMKKLIAIPSHPPPRTPSSSPSPSSAGAAASPSSSLVAASFPASSLPLSEPALLAKSLALVETSRSIVRSMLFDIESIYSPHVLSLQSLLEESFAHFNDANNYHILNLLSTHASLLEDKYRARMDSIQLPTQEESIHAAYEALANDALFEFSVFAGMYPNHPSHEGKERDLNHLLMNVRDKALLQNHRALVSLLDESQRSSVVSYGIAIEKETREALGSALLESAHERCKHEAMLLFNAQIHADTLQWIEQESVYRAQRALAESEIQHRYMDVAIQNQRKVHTICSNFLVQLVSSYRQSQSSHAFPSEESDLIAPSRLYFHQLLQRYDTELAAFADHEVYIQVKEHLEAELEEELSVLLDKNVKITKSLSLAAFRCAEDILRKQQCTYCLSNIWPLSFQWKGQKAARYCFTRSEDTRQYTISEALMEKVIRDWIQVDLSAELVAIYNRSLLVISILFFSLIGLAYGCRKCCRCLCAKRIKVEQANAHTTPYAHAYMQTRSSSSFRPSPASASPYSRSGGYGTRRRSSGRGLYL